MILGTGIDLVSISRFQEMPTKDRLAKRILTDVELGDYLDADDKGLFLARSWAVKEAVAKSFGTGIDKETVWKNIALKKTPLGQPVVLFLNELEHEEKICHVSISHDGDMLIANAVLSYFSNGY
jgi:holo-[acyl-carrier protein] synthase